MTSISIPRVTREELLASVPDIVHAIAPGARERERDRDPPFFAFDLIRRARLGTLAVPAAMGGPGGSITDVLDVVADLATGDSNVAHALRSHFNFIEQTVLADQDAQTRQHMELILAGNLFGAAVTELATARAGIITTSLTRDGTNYRLNGRKFYATGTAYSDYFVTTALKEDGSTIGVFLPLKRDGVNVLDDWDGVGQRLTASGSIEFHDVRITPDELVVRRPQGLAGRHTSAYRQAILAACQAGIVGAALNDALAYVHRHARPTPHSSAQTAAQDPFVQQTIGEIHARGVATRTLIRAAGAALDAGHRAILSKDPKAEVVVTETAVTVASTQIMIGEIALKAAEILFDIGGGSATLRDYALDRHWRNIRTILNHNPARHKARVIGAHLLGEDAAPLTEGRFF